MRSWDAPAGSRRRRACAGSPPMPSTWHAAGEAQAGASTQGTSPGASHRGFVSAQHEALSAQTARVDKAGEGSPDASGRVHLLDERDHHARARHVLLPVRLAQAAGPRPDARAVPAELPHAAGGGEWGGQLRRQHEQGADHGRSGRAREACRALQQGVEPQQGAAQVQVRRDAGGRRRRHADTQLQVPALQTLSHA